MSSEASTTVTPCLWFDRDAEAAATFYCSLLPGSQIESVQRTPAETPGAGEGQAIMVVFILGGRRFLALNAGSPATASHAVSLSIDCVDQAEVDRIWDALADGGTPNRCGWIADRWGFSWQVVPRALPRLLGDPDRARAKRAMQAMMTMTKIDVAALEAAADAA